MIPVGHGGQRLAAELGERRSLVPADSRDGVILLASRVLARFPGGRPGPARPVGHSSHGLLPRNDPTVLHERVVPQLAAPVAATVHEALELAVGHLEPIHQVVAQPDGLDVLEARVEHVEIAACDPDHVRRQRTVPIERDRGIAERQADELERSIPRPLDAQPVRVEPSSAYAQREQHAVERRLPEQHPGGVWCGILLSPHGGARRVGVQVHPPREPGPERSEKGVVGIRGVDPPGQRIRRVPLAQFRQGEELGDALLPGPVSFACPSPRTEPRPRAEDHHRDNRSREERRGPAAHHSCSAATGRGGHAAARRGEGFHVRS